MRRRCPQKTLSTPFLLPTVKIFADQSTRCREFTSFRWIRLVIEAEQAARLSIQAVILFGIPAVKDDLGSENFSEQGIVQQAVRALKNALPDLVVIVDLCMCEYTDHGHCGVVRDGQIDNDATLEILGKAAYLMPKPVQT